MLGRGAGHSVQALGARALRVVPHDLAPGRAPLPVPGACPCVSPRYAPSGPDVHQAVAVGSTLGIDGRGRFLI